MAELYVVATPIGNLDDITLRALEILRGSELIVCEDTRHTRKLLSHYDIHAQTAAFHAHSSGQSVETLVHRIEGLTRVSLVTDAGTPGVSDPGAILVQACREAGHRIIPIPGVSALTALVSVAGPVGRTVVFDGFLSPKSGKRKNRLSELVSRKETFVVYESPHRLVKMIADLADVFPEADVVIGREMTKAFEEIMAGSVQEVLEMLSSRSQIKGECAVLVRAARIH